jgi:flagellin
MSISISSNFAASAAARNLEVANKNLQKSLTRLSSGTRISSPQDDAAGNAVQLKLKASATRYGAVKNNIQNAISFLQVQDGLLTTATEVVSRIAELKAMTSDNTKNAEDFQNYNEEYQVLREQLTDLQSQKFNDVSVFLTESGMAGYSSAITHQGVFNIFTSEDQGASPSDTSVANVWINGLVLGATGAGGAGAISQGQVAVAYSISSGFSGNVDSTGTSGGIMESSLSMDAILSDLQGLANARARNGALQSRLGFAYDNASITKTNLEAARGRIVDLDIAEESTAFAKHNIMAQAASSILSQANATSRSTLQLLLG